MRASIFFMCLFGSFWAQNDEVALFMPPPASGSDMALETRGRFYQQFNKFLDWLMSFQNLSYETEDLESEIVSAPECLVEFEVEHGFFSGLKPLVAQYTPVKQDRVLVEKVLEKIDQQLPLGPERLFYIQEILAKVLAYRHLEEGDTITLPDFSKPLAPSLYRVSEVFNLGLGMPAFALTSKDQDKPSILLYRGTHLDLTHKAGIASVIADLDLYGPGYSAFFKIQTQLDAFFVSQKLKQRQVVVLGYSLGGILSLYTHVFFTPFIDHNYSCAFNPPGVQKKLFNLWRQKDSLAQFKVYVNQHDPVSKWGFLIGDVQIVSAQERMGPLMAHTKLMGSEQTLLFFLCPLEQENRRHRYFFVPQ